MFGNKTATASASPAADDIGAEGRRAVAPAAAPSATATEDMSGKVHALRFELVAQRAYAEDRAGALEAISACIALAGIVAGASVFADVSGHAIGRYILGVAVAVIGGAEVVFAFSKRAAQWRAVAEKSNALSTDLMSLAAPTPQQLLDIRRRNDELTLPSERRYHIAHKIAWNTARRELGADASSPPIPVGSLAAMTRNIFAGHPDR